MLFPEVSICFLSSCIKMVIECFLSEDSILSLQVFHTPYNNSINKKQYIICIILYIFLHNSDSITLPTLSVTAGRKRNLCVDIMFSFMEGRYTSPTQVCGNPVEAHKQSTSWRLLESIFFQVFCANMTKPPHNPPHGNNFPLHDVPITRPLFTFFFFIYLYFLCIT